ncbi:MAG: threonine synthase [Ignavibacteria bacterium]|jgi:threonine synthase
MKYRCSTCGRVYSRDEVRYLCPDCSKDYKPGIPLRGVLEVVFDYEFIKKNFDKSNPDWNLFSAVEPEFFPNYPVGNTPFFKIDNFGKESGYENLWLKNDGLNPSGSLKDRASFLIVAEANRLKENIVVTASTGNAASALAAVCAADKKKAIIFVPKSAPKAKLVQMYLYGAEVIKVKGTYDDAFRLSLEYTENNPGLNRNTAFHPLTIEGKKTAGLEIFFQNNFKVPDVILIPVGDGVIISGVYKAFYDLKKSGLIEKLPRLICVQAEKSNAIHNFIQTGIYKNAENPNTIADSISVSVPSNAYMAKKAVEESKGFSITVSDEEILNAQKILTSKTGIFAEPSSSSTIAALLKLKESELLDKKEQIVILITGNGLKDIDSVKIF